MQNGARLFRWPRCLARATMGVVRTEIISSTAHAFTLGLANLYACQSNIVSDAVAYDEGRGQKNELSMFRSSSSLIIVDPSNPIALGDVIVTMAADAFAFPYSWIHSLPILGTNALCETKGCFFGNLTVSLLNFVS